MRGLIVLCISLLLSAEATKSDLQRGWPMWFPKPDVDDEARSNKTISSKAEESVIQNESDNREDGGHADKPTESKRSWSFLMGTPKDSEEHLPEPTDNTKSLITTVAKGIETAEEGTETDNETTATKTVFVIVRSSPASDDDDESENDELPSEETLPQNTSGRIPVQQSDRTNSQSPSVFVADPPRHHSKRRRHSPEGTPSSVSRQQVVEILGAVLPLTRCFLYAWSLSKHERAIISPSQHFVWERLNDRYVKDAACLEKVMQLPPTGVWNGAWKWKHVRKVQGPTISPKLNLAETFTRTLVVVQLDSTQISQSDMIYFEEAVDFLIQSHRQRAFGTHKDGSTMELEIAVQLCSPGGSVATFGLVAAQFARLTNEPGISTTVLVDKYAASGGYMIASQADKLIAAPFATLGSIGVILQGLNYNEIAKRFGVQPMVIKAGKSKARLTKFGEVSRSDLASEQQDLEKTHESFRAFVVRGRPGLANKLDTVADGSVFLGEEALHLGLVDGVMTSRQYIQERVHAGDRVLKLHRVTPRSIDLRQLANPSNWISHARSWASNIGKSDQSGKIAWFLQAGSLVGLARHIFRQYNG